MSFEKQLSSLFCVKKFLSQTSQSTDNIASLDKQLNDLVLLAMSCARAGDYEKFEEISEEVERRTGDISAPKRILMASSCYSLGRAYLLCGLSGKALRLFYRMVMVLYGPESEHLAKKIFLEVKKEISNLFTGFARKDVRLKSEPAIDFQGSKQYWDERYKLGGSSGKGSYGRLAEFKAEVVNKFIVANDIKSMVDLGCGDGNQLSKFEIKEYIGVDASQSAVDLCKRKYKGEKNKKFFTLGEFKGSGIVADASLSMDVIFHLVEDEVYEEYMNILFDSSKRFCVIYSSDKARLDTNVAHVRGRSFTEWVRINKKEWRLMSITYNKFRYDEIKNPSESSYSDFYFYEKV